MNASSVRLRSPEFRDGQVGGSLLQRGEWFNKIRGRRRVAADKLEKDFKPWGYRRMIEVRPHGGAQFHPGNDSG